MRPRFSFATIAGLAMFAVVTPRIAAAQTYSITYLKEGKANAINTSGHVVSSTPNHGEFGYLWTPTTPNGTIGASTALPTLPLGKATWLYSYPLGVNAADQVAGYTDFATILYALHGPKPFDVYSATLWQNGTATALPGHGDSFAYGINDNGDVVGIVDAKAGYPVGFVGTATLWRNGRNQTRLPAPNGYSSEATAINNIGQIVGKIVNPSLWQNGNAYDLGNLPGFGEGTALTINGSGSVVGYAGDGYYSSRAFLWTPANPNGTTGSMRDLGVLPGFTQSVALGVNASGQVVGSSNNSSGAFPWDSVHGMLDLNALVPAGSGWRDLVSANAINDKGQIAGWGYRDESSFGAFLLTPQ